MKRILVTGGAGFIGSYLCERLLQNDARVICVDNFYTGSRANIQHLLNHPRFELHQHDMVHAIDVEVDEIYNLACPASPVHYQKEPIKTIHVNIFGAMHVLELAQKYNCRVLQASTSEIYGDPDIHPQHEEYWGNVNCTGLRACYNEGKRLAETLFFTYYRQYQLDIRIARIFNTYGPRMHPNDGRVVSNFIVQALAQEPLTIYGNGQQTRSFCYVSDTVEALVRLMASDDATATPVNIGNPEEFSISELAMKIIAFTGSASPIVHLPLSQDDPRKRRPDISRAMQYLDWQPTISVDQGLRQTIEYFYELQSVRKYSA